jgi:phage terminase large subunit
MMSEDEYAQEYECSFEAAVKGAYYGKEMNDAEVTTHLGLRRSLRSSPACPYRVGSWRCGLYGHLVRSMPRTRNAHYRRAQGRGRRSRLVCQAACRSAITCGATTISRTMSRSGAWDRQSRKEVLAGLGIKATVCPNIPDCGWHPGGADAAPDMLVRQGEVQGGIEALRMYRREYDEKRQEFRQHPLHDWTSHYADALRYFAVGHKNRPEAHQIQFARGSYERRRSPIPVLPPARKNPALTTGRCWMRSRRRSIPTTAPNMATRKTGAHRSSRATCPRPPITC